MKFELFRKIVHDMQEFNQPFKMAHLNGFGEPLINPYLADFIRMLKEKTVAEKVSITTNASLLNKEKSRELINAGLDKIHISIYALNDEGYMKFSNAKISFTMLYENIQYLYSIKGKCHIHTKIAGDYFSEEEKAFFLDKFSNVSDTIHIDHAIDNWPGLDIMKGNVHMYSESLGGEKICPMPFYQMVIHSNGKVSPCCVEYQQKLIIGDINTHSLKDIWNGVAVQNLRKNILADTIEENSVCTYCRYPECGATVDITPYREELMKLY